MGWQNYIINANGSFVGYCSIGYHILRCIEFDFSIKYVIPKKINATKQK